MESKTRLVDQVRTVLRLKHLSFRTEEAYVGWIRRFILFHDKRHPRDIGAEEIRAFLAHLAVHDHVAASTQNVALNALVFLYRHVLKLDFPEIENLERAKRPRRVPAVFTREEATAMLAQLNGMNHLMASLLYGAGLRLMECARLRVKDVDFAYQQITVRDGKGAQDRVTMLPRSVQELLQRHLVKVKLLHEDDLAEGFGQVYLPYAMARKDPGAGTSWVWQYVFPASRRSIDPRSCKCSRRRVKGTEIAASLRLVASGIVLYSGRHSRRKGNGRSSSKERNQHEARYQKPALQQL